MRVLLLALALLLAVSPAFAQWSSSRASLTTAPIKIDKVQFAAYYHFTDATDSGWLHLYKYRTYTVCLDADIAGTGGSATVQIRREISAATANGSYAVDDVVLTGIAPLACLAVQGGRSIMVDVVTAPNSTTAIVSVEADKRG